MLTDLDQPSFSLGDKKLFDLWFESTSQIMKGKDGNKYAVAWVGKQTLRTGYRLELRRQNSCFDTNQLLPLINVVKKAPVSFEVLQKVNGLEKAVNLDSTLSHKMLEIILDFADLVQKELDMSSTVLKMVRDLLELLYQHSTKSRWKLFFRQFQPPQSESCAELLEAKNVLLYQLVKYEMLAWQKEVAKKGQPKKLKD